MKLWLQGVTKHRVTFVSDDAVRIEGPSVELTFPRREWSKRGRPEAITLEVEAVD